MLDGPHFSGTPGPGLDLISQKQGAMFVTGSLQRFHVPLRGGHITSFSLLRLDNHHCHIVGRGIRRIEHVIHIFGTLQVTTRIFHIEAAPITVSIRNMDDSGYRWPKSLPVDFTGGQRSGSAPNPVISTVECHNLRSSSNFSSKLDRCFQCAGTALCEVADTLTTKPFRHDPGHFGCQFDAPGIGHIHSMH